MLLVYLHGLRTVWLRGDGPEVRGEHLAGRVQHGVAGADCNNTIKHNSNDGLYTTNISLNILRNLAELRSLVEILMGQFLLRASN